MRINVVLTSSVLVGLQVALSHGKVWINEVHYENVGADANEFVEIVVAPDMAGLDLSLVDVHLYSGANGATYGKINFGAPTATSMINGYSVYSVDMAPIQNGAPDGLALTIGDILVSGQFLSYEGAFTGIGGPADGVLSSDVAVRETPSTGVDQSIQLTGDGDDYPDFVWAGPALASPGMVNANQFLTAIPEPSALWCVGAAATLSLTARRTRRLWQWCGTRR